MLLPISTIYPNVILVHFGLLSTLNKIWLFFSNLPLSPPTTRIQIPSRLLKQLLIFVHSQGLETITSGAREVAKTLALNTANPAFTQDFENLFILIVSLIIGQVPQASVLSFIKKKVESFGFKILPSILKI